MSTPSKSSPLTVPLRELPADRRVELGSEFVREALAGLPMREALERPADDPRAGEVSASLSLYGEEDNVFVRGPLEGWLEVACSRCLGPARVEFDESLAVTFLPKARIPAEDEDGGEDKDKDAAGDGAAAKSAKAKSAKTNKGAKDTTGDEAELGVELEDDDIDLYGYEGESIDLTPLFHDQVVLAVPFAPLCHEDCKGLCPQCGVDRNRETCDCKPPIDPRWVALQNLKS
ncbi:YceD family protein [Haliangium ochraceum]|uniref:DUF177 domain-containing protein n=1 Tax=Haliangium ochraceum (strain DSM 14365 / JCM 11303 / SMP-2) TaxID=502025 RepID=D0LYW6_HALO1|nr:DUF177 domain-containing protein [Haliangium ochraceum]ACY14436.1 protein of unknown function DUF177 [Haliangium ochraceum DSM 14365]